MNAASSAFLLAAGFAMLRIGTDAVRRHILWFSYAAIGAGLGSIAFHASLREWAGWADLAGVGSILAFALVYRTVTSHSFPRAYGGAVFVIAIVIPVVGTANGKYVLGALGAAALVAEVRTIRETNVPWDWRWLGAATALLGAGVIFWWMGGSGHALCAAESRWQWHGVWHLLAGAALVALFMYWRSAPSRRD